MADTDNIYVLWANRLKSGAADGILTETDQLFDSHLSTNMASSLSTMWGEAFELGIGTTVLGSSVDQKISSYVHELSSNATIGTEEIYKRQDVINYALIEHLKGSIKTSIHAYKLSSQAHRMGNILYGLNGDAYQLASEAYELGSNAISNIQSLDKDLSSYKGDVQQSINTINQSLNIIDANTIKLNTTKSGDSFYDIESQFIYFFKNTGDRVAWCVNKDVNSDLILNKQSVTPNFKVELGNTSAKIGGYRGDTVATIPSATYESAGVMSAEDKTKLDNIYTTIGDKQEKMKVVYQKVTTYSVPLEIGKNTILKIENEVAGTLNVFFEEISENDKLTQYGLYFSVGNSTSASLSLPNNIRWANDASIAISANRTYEILFTTCDNGGTYTATYTSYSRESVDDTDNKPYFTTTYTTGGKMMIARRGSKPSSEQPYYYSKFDTSTNKWGAWTQMQFGSYVTFEMGKYRWKCNGYSNISSITNTTSGDRTGSNINQSYTAGSLYYSFVWGNSTTPKVELSGNILSLLWGDEFTDCENKALPSGAFQRLFRVDTGNTNNTYITDASKLILPSKTLSTGAYYQMFMRCTAMTGMPKIMAETAGNCCCKDMFAFCTSLTSVQDMKFIDFGTTIHACAGMFYGCTTLKTSKVPPATKLACGTYYQMYKECTGLTTAADIPAIGINQYNSSECNTSMRQMFEGCTNLVKMDGSLKVKIPGANCYLDMFKNCTSLKIAPEILLEQNQYGCCQNMFLNCTSLTVPPPYLPRTVVAGGQQAFQEMFKGCTSLEYGPTLPAEVPVKQMYYGMFYGCTSLKNIPYIGLYRILPATSVNSSKCVEFMFKDCNALKHVELSKNLIYNSANMDYSDAYSGIFNHIFTDCNNLKTIRLCYDFVGKTADFTSNAFASLFGFILNENANSRWFTHSSTGAAKDGGTLYIPKSLGNKLRQQGTLDSFKSHMIPDNWVIVEE